MEIPTLMHLEAVEAEAPEEQGANSPKISARAAAEGELFSRPVHFSLAQRRHLAVQGARTVQAAASQAALKIRWMSRYRGLCMQEMA